MKKTHVRKSGISIISNKRRLFSLIIFATLSTCLVILLLIPVLALDTTPPSIISVTPANNSVNVSLKTYPIIVFSEPVNPATLEGLVNGMPIVPIQAVFDASYQTLTIDLGDMEYQKTYTMVIRGSLEDNSGNQMGSDYTFRFTTATGVSKRPTSTIVVPSGLEPGNTYVLTGTATGYVWQKDADNPLELRHWNQYGVDTGDRPMLHPTALYFPEGYDGYKFYLIYTPYPGATDENPSLMRSSDGENFDAVGVTNPLFTYNTQPIYDSQNLADPEAIKVGDTWMIFYEMEQTNYGHLGVALSTDGVHYTPYGGPYSPARPMLPWPTDGNPVIYFSDDTWYEHDDNPADSIPRLGEPAVIFKDGLFHMWYCSYNPAARAVYATATDPRGPWTKYGPVFDNGRHPDVVYDPERDLYVMWYLSGQNSIATTTRPEGPWTPHPNNPVFTAEGGWEGSSLYRSALVQVGTQWYLYYSANPGSNGMIGLAREVPGIRKAEISTNGGLSWTQLTVNPDGTWSYPWTPASRGTYSIQVRVTDDWMVGEPSEAVAWVGYPSEPTNPILVIVKSSLGSFSEYTGEILKAEGINEFQMAELSQVDASFLASFDTVILTTMSLSTSEAAMIQNYVIAGGNLIAFKPDGQLAPIFGLTPAGTTTSEGYIKIDDTTDIGKGIVTETIQFHGTADNYNLNGAFVIATLYSDSITPTLYPAVATYTVGYGKTVFFAYDLPKSIVYLRQGNPENANKELDGAAGLRPSELFVGWLDVRKVPIPQADEQMRLLSNAIMRLNYYKKPLPRFWYFPDFEKTMFIMTGDSDGASSAQVNSELAEIEARGGKFSFYMTSWESLTNVQDWTSRGHEVGWHPSLTSDYTAMYNAYTSFINTFYSNYGYKPETIRHHAIKWVGYADPAKIQDAHGVRMEFNYYHWGSWLNPGDGFRNGWMTGSGIPMKFADENGVIYNSYQVNTNFPDETMAGVSTGAQAAAIAATFFDKSRDGFYSAFAGNFHPVSWSGERRNYGLALMDAAVSRGIPIWNAKQLLDFTDAKSRATFQNIQYSDGQLTFNLNLPVEINNLPVMLPYEHEGRTLNSIAVNSNPQSFSTETIKGIKYAWFLVSSVGSYQVTAIYGPDTTPPEITIVYPVNGAVLPAGTASVSITVNTNEYADCRYSTNPVFEYWTEGTDFTLGQGTLMHSFTLSGLRGGQTYHLYYKAKDTTGNINDVSTHHTFSVAFEDITPPEWRNQGQSKSYVLPGDSNLLYAEGRDDYGLHYAILSTDETGVWKNFTWWDTSWQYRKPITLTENSGSILSNYQVGLVVNYVPSKMKSDFSDLRFTASNQMTPIPYWIESYTASGAALVWVRVPSIPVFGTTTIYMYYGNPSATDSSDGTTTFEFFDNFRGTTLDPSKWTEDAVNDITHTINNYFRFEDAIKSSSDYWIYDGTDTGSQHQARWTPISQFIIEFKSRLNDLTTTEMGEGLVGLVATDNTVIGVAGHHDWQGDAFLPWRGVVTENAASSIGAGVTIHASRPTMAYKPVTTTDASTWMIINDGITLKFYDKDGFFAQASISSPISKLALAAGAYAGVPPLYPYVDYIQIDYVKVRKYASVEPSSAIGSEEVYGMGGTIGPWLDTSWPYRKSVTITENSGSALSNYQVGLVVDYVPSKMKSDFSDLRFTDNDKVTPISYWIESYTPSVSALVWIKVPTIPASGATTVYMYYGNPSATSASDGPATFDFFDDFEDGIIDSSKWITSGIVTETSGYLQTGSGADSLARQNTANYPFFSRPYALRHRGLVGATDSLSIYIGWGNADLTRFALAPHGRFSYYTYDGTGQYTDNPAGQTSYQVYDILWTSSNVKYYQNGVLMATHTNPPSVSMGAYMRTYTITSFTRCDWILVRKLAPSEPSSVMGAEEAYEPPVMHYYHGSPIHMGDVAETWVLSDFTWYNPTIPEGTRVSWKIWYVDTSGNWNSTDTMTFTISRDVTPPITVDDYDGLWHISDFTITLTATDDLSGVAETYYRINDGPTRTVSADGQPLIITEGADNRLEYWSVDMIGNEESHHILTGIKLDKTPPVISGAPTTSPNAYGWYNMDVTVHFTASDILSGIDYVTADQTLTVEGTGQSVDGMARDIAGNVAYFTVVGINIDKTPPSISGAATTAPNAHGWYKADVTVHFEASDTLSGIDFITPDQTLTTEGTGQSVVGTAMDKAGNEISYTVSDISIDKTPPLITGSPTTSPNAYGWYNTDVVVHFDASDVLSGIDTVTPDQTLTGEGADQTVVGTAVDKAGNTASYMVSGINIDKTPPAITGAPTTSPNAYNWYNTDVIVHFTASDSLSGIDILTPYQILSSEGSDQTVTGTATDKAGNSASFTVSGINIDKTPPSISGAATTPPNEHGWYNTDVVVQFTAIDALSGIAELTHEQILTAEGAGQFVTGSATDKAGNTASYTVSDINIDKTPPEITAAPTEPANIYGWYRTDVTVHFTASDSLSGLDAITPDQTLSDEGAGQSVTGFATDMAGNTASFTVAGINIDKTPPTVTGAPTTPANAYGWYRTDVVVHFDASDSLSGLDTVTPDQTLSSEGAGQFVIGTAVDRAGNGASFSVVDINIDKTPPSITGAPTTSPNAHDWYRTDVTVHFTASDALSGLDTLTPDQTLTAEGAGQFVIGTATDRAGNSASFTVNNINIDKTPPTISGAPTTPANVHGWYKTNVIIHFEASDSLSGIDTLTPDITLSTEGASQSATGTAIDNAGNEATYTVSGINIDKTPPSISGAPTTSPNAYGWYKTDVTVHFTASDSLSGIDTVTPDQTLTGEGAGQWVAGTAVDKAGNSASCTVSGINIDKTIPTSSLTIGEPKYGTDPTYVSLTTTFTLSGTDALSGIDYVEYRFGDSGPWTLYSAPFAAPGIGSYTLYYHSVDRATNIEPAKSVWIVVSATTLTYTGATSGQYSDPVALSARLIDIATQLPISGKTISFAVGTQSTTAVTNSEGVAATSIILDQQTGSYTVSATFAGDVGYLGSSDQKTFIINKEDATVNYTGDTIVPTTSKYINLRATVFDSDDGYWGDLTKIQVTFRIYTAPVNLNGPYLVVGPMPVSLTDTPGVGVATGAISNLPENSYVVIVSFDASINRYYSGPTSDPALLTVYKPTGTFVTGGGWIWDPTGSKGNFGFVVRYTKSGQVQGHSVYVYRDGDWDYIVKSTAWIGLAIEEPHAYFQGKCVVQKYNPVTRELIWAEGNYQFRVDVWDYGEPGNTDVYQIRVLDKNGALFHEAGFDPFGYLQGGNIIIHDPRKRE